MKKLLTTILIIFICGIGFSQDLSVGYPIFDFSGGVNLKDYPDLLKPNQVQDAQNILFDEKLGLVKRELYDRICSLPVASTVKIKGGCVFKKDDGSKYYIVQAGTNVYSCTDIDNPTWTIFNPFKLSSLYPLSYAVHYNKLWCTNGIDTVFSYDGTTATEYSFIPKGQYILSSKGRLWLIATIDNPNNVYFSEINIDPITTDLWDTENNVFHFGLGSGQTIRAARELNNIIYIFLENSFYAILGNAEASADDFYIINKSMDYGCLSNRSITENDNGIIFLDKKGLFYFEGSNISLISENIKPDIDKLGLININSKKIINTSDTDFNQGTFSNSFASGGSVLITTYTTTWSTKANFEASGYSVDRTSVTATGIKLNTQSGTIESKVDLTESSVGNFAGYYRSGGGSTGFNSVTQSAPISTIIDDNYLTHHDTVWLKTGYWSWMSFYKDITHTPMALSRIKLKYRCEGGGGVTAPNLNFNNHEVWVTNADGSGIYKLGDLNRSIDGVEYVADFPITRTDTTYGFPTEIQIRGVPYWDGDTGINLRYAVGVYYELEAYTTGTNPVYYSSGTYTSPIFDSGQTTTQYQYLRWNNSLTNGVSTGTVRMYTRSDDDSGMASPTAWYEVGTASAISTSVDSQRYFQYKAELMSSSGTFTPAITDVELQYATTSYATFTSKVFDAGTKLTSWGSFLTDDDGTINYQIRSGTWTFAIADSTPMWISISSGDDITISTNNTKVEYRALTQSKDAKINSVILTYFENLGGVGGGSQDVAAISKDNRYLFSCSTGTSNNDLIEVFDKNKSWTRYTGISAAGFLKDDNNVYVLSSTAPIVLQLDVAGGSEGYCNSILKTGDLVLNEMDKEKWLRYAFFTNDISSGSIINFDYSVDKSTTSQRKTVDFTNYRNVPIQFDQEVIGKVFTFTLSSTNSFTNNGMLKGFKIYSETKDLNPLNP